MNVPNTGQDIPAPNTVIPAHLDSNSSLTREVEALLVLMKMAVDSGANLDTLVIFADSSSTGVLHSSPWSSNWDSAGNWQDADGWDDNDLYDLD
ncbi:hypothetical protein K438DRAFT_1973946 [Mycena galopus ATCC 62051]|nr:hypothetical protein K438DRAFT_1973946 [Mycena galopus ATCC 62051]